MPLFIQIASDCAPPDIARTTLF